MSSRHTVKKPAPLSTHTGSYGVIPANLILDQRIGDAAVRVYGLLSARADNNGYCWPKLETMGGDLGISLKSVSDNIAVLRRYGWVQSERHQRNVYHVCRVEPFPATNPFDVMVIPEQPESDIMLIPDYPDSGTTGVKNVTQLSNSVVHVEELEQYPAGADTHTDVDITPHTRTREDDLPAPSFMEWWRGQRWQMQTASFETCERQYSKFVKAWDRGEANDLSWQSGDFTWQ